MISVVFSALAAESFINYYALSKGKDKSYLRRFKSSGGLSESVVKWIDIPNEITGRFALNEGSAEVSNLQKLFTDRNKLAHHKQYSGHFLRQRLKPSFHRWYLLQ